MASISNDPGGRRRLQFVTPDGKRMTIRLGKVPKKAAESVARYVEDLIAAKISGQSILRDTAAWVAALEGPLYDKLAAAKLTEPRNILTVGEFFGQWIENKQASGYKPASILAWRQSVLCVTKRIGDKALGSLTHIDGESFRADMRSQGLRPATIHKRLGHARQIIEDAVRQGHLVSNPWKHVRSCLGDPSDRRAYVTVADVERAIEYCPNVWWRLLVALARFGGLRIPSEAFSLKWSDVDWERNRMSVPSPKTERLEKTHRVIPLFTLIRPHLEAAFDQATEGSIFVFPEEYRVRATGPGGWAGANMRTTFAKIVRKAGIEPWPRIWHSLRSSCESDLAQSFSLSTVTKWFGNTPSVALRHYVDPTDESFNKALGWVPEKGVSKSVSLVSQKASQHVPAPISKEMRDKLQPKAEQPVMPLGATWCASGDIVKRECMGIEPTGSFVQTPRWF